MGRADHSAIRLCGRLDVALGDRNVTAQLPGRQGRLLLAYLACNRGRPVSRGELIELLWAVDAPAQPEAVLGALLSKLRRALGPGVLEGRRAVTLALPDGVSVDVDVAAAAIRRAEAALAAGDSQVAWQEAQAARDIASGGFLPGYDNRWVQEQERTVEDLLLRALECAAAAALAAGGAGLPVAEQAARESIALAPLRERGHRLLMEALVAQGDVAQAMQAYERLRIRLRDDLGIVPGAAIRALHERLLTGDGGGEEAVPEPAPPPEARPREERKVVTVLAGLLDDGAGAGDPEDLRALRRRVRERVRSELERFAATVEAPAQDTVVALFGAPVGHEDDAERAVRAALRLLETGLATRTGLATGEVLVTPASSSGGLATGHAVGEALRLAREAPARAVAADGATVRSTGRAVSYDAVAPDRAWLVRGVRDRSAPILEHPARTRFVGRGGELELLESLHRTVVEEQRPRLVMLLGHAGVGKSRLVDEFVTRVQASSAPAVYRGRCLPYGEGITYWALREILWTATGIRLDDPAAAAAAKLRDLVHGVLGDRQAERVGAALAVSAGIALADNPVERLSPGSVADEVALAWPALLTALAAEAPLVIVVEDLHWAEHALLAMLERVLARSSGPLLVVVTARPEFAEGRPAWTSRPGMSQISLEPLTEAQSRELVAELLPGDRRGLREQVSAAAEGNPFFAEELARHVAGPDAQAGVIPATVRALLAARVDALPAAQKQVLQDAAVVGRVFWATTLDSIEARPGLREALRALEDRGLVVTRPASSLPGQTELSFRHGLTREVAYRSIPRARRCQAHAAVGRWLERLAGDRREEFVDLLAYHFEAASAPGDAALAWPPGSSEHERLRAKAFQALIEAGDAMRKRLFVAAALKFAHRAQALAATDHERLGALELEARTHHAALHGDEALAAYLAAMHVAQALGDGAARSRLRAHATLLCVRYAGTLSRRNWRDAAIGLVEGGLAEDDGAATLERGALLVGRAWGLRRWLGRGDLRSAKRDAEQAIAIAEAVASPELLTTALEALGWLVLEEGFCETGAMADRLLRAAMDSPDRGESHESLVTAAMSLCWAGDLHRAASVARAATARATELSGHRALHSAAAEALCLTPAGRLLELGRATDRVLQLGRAEGDRTCGTASVALAGRVLWLFETQDADAAAGALELLRRLRPVGGRPLFDYVVADMLRPFVPPEDTRALIERSPSPHESRAEAILHLRARLPLLAAGAGDAALGEAIAEARRLARSACAPALWWTAEWAAALRSAAEAPAQALERARAAAANLEASGERYTSARLLIGFLAVAGGAAARELAEEVAGRCEAMGARASAALAREGRATVATTAPRP